MACRRGIVPPHLLRAIADNTLNSDKITERARRTLAHSEARVSVRTELTRRCAPNSIIPSYLHQGIADSDANTESQRDRAKRSLDTTAQLLAGSRGDSSQSAERQELAAKTAPSRSVYNADNTTNESDLPGKLIRKEGQGKAKDKPVNEAYDNVGIVLDFYKKRFNWHSIDNKNMDVVSSVHFGEEYENAFWDPQRRQMVFGDGGEFLNNFTGCIDVIGHELTHAVTEQISPLDYYGQSGALNEHLSDVFGIMVKQQVQKEKSNVADWLIGEDCILPGVKGVALRSMKAPGTAYDDPRFGKDPQPAHMRDYRVTYEDNGGVHIYSGIPNKAFYLAAVAFDGYSWEKAGKIWWEAMRSGKISSDSKFSDFANVTVDVAGKHFDKDTAKIIRKAWTDVGVGKAK